MMRSLLNTLRPGSVLRAVSASQSRAALNWKGSSLVAIRSLADLRDHTTSAGPFDGQSTWSRIAYGALGLGFAASAYQLMSWQISMCEAAEATKTQTFSAAEVAAHRTPETGIWVTYKGGVYDITEFVDIHPGGKDKIMLAAGGSIEPFWAMFQQHTKEEVRELLEEYRIGKLEGYVETKQSDPYQNEPGRHPALKARSHKPFNGESPPAILASSCITPTDLHYVRNHLPVPKVDAAAYTLTITGQGVRTVQLTLEDLRSLFRKYSVVATLECAGNRRTEMKTARPGIKGLDWDQGAISTAEWSGVRLKDVLHYAGLEPDDPHVRHIQFEGLDNDMTGAPYGASIPVHKALDPYGDVLLAYEMNGSDIPIDHGFPVRLVAPGTVAARSVKWLGKIVASSEESPSFWQQYDYKAFSPAVEPGDVDWKSAPAIQEMPVISAICLPSTSEKIPAGSTNIPVRGYAWSGGGRDIVRVDVSADGGKTWTVAKLEKTDAVQSRAWAWTLWEAAVPVPKDAAGQVELVCKATDAAYNTQPDTVPPIWNLRGLANNAWHRVTLQVEAQ